MNINQLANDFLKKHANADEIVMDTKTKLPVKAIYNGVDLTGNIRTEPAIFWFYHD